MNKRQISILPMASTATMEGPRLEFDGQTVTVTLRIDDGDADGRFAIVFDGSKSIKYTSERLCQKWNVEGCYDAICVVEDSEWLSNLGRGKDVTGLSHFMIYLDSFGCIEAIAQSGKILTL